MPSTAPAEHGDIAANVSAVRGRIALAAERAGRAASDVHLVAVSKTKPVAAVRAAYAAGVRDFGENYLQESLDKMAELSDLPLRWHFIGPLQSNKTRAVAEHFDWVHSVDRLKIARRLSEQRPQGLPPLNLCLQVNISGEGSKAGIGLDELPALAAESGAIDKTGLVLSGVGSVPEMLIPAATAMSLLGVTWMIRRHLVAVRNRS